MACSSNDVELAQDQIPALLGTHLATLFLHNKLSAHETQHLATMAHLAGADGIAQLAKVGNAGKASKNNARDLKRLVKRGCEVPKPYMATIPIWDPTNNKKIFVEHPTMLPHEVSHFLVATGCVTAGGGWSQWQA